MFFSVKCWTRASLSATWGASCRVVDGAAEATDARRAKAAEMVEICIVADRRLLGYVLMCGGVGPNSFVW